MDEEKDRGPRWFRICDNSGHIFIMIWLPVMTAVICFLTIFFPEEIDNDKAPLWFVIIDYLVCTTLLLTLPMMILSCIAITYGKSYVEIYEDLDVNGSIGRVFAVVFISFIITMAATSISMELNPRGLNAQTAIICPNCGTKVK